MGDDVGDFTSDAGVSPSYLAVANDGTSKSSAEVEIHEIVERFGCSAAFGARSPVDVVIDRDLSAHLIGNELCRGEFADQERGVGEVDEASGGAVDRVSSTDNGHPRRDCFVAEHTVD